MAEMFARFIDAGDRVVVKDAIADEAHARTPKPEAAGKRGVVESNDGWGLCRVLLDDGTQIMAWNTKDLEREQSPEPGGDE
jgi:hypothetical protein